MRYLCTPSCVLCQTSKTLTTCTYVKRDIAGKVKNTVEVKKEKEELGEKEEKYK